MHEDDGFEEEFVDGVVGAEEGGFGGGEERVPCLREERVSKGVEGVWNDLFGGVVGIASIAMDGEVLQQTLVTYGHHCICIVAGDFCVLDVVVSPYG